MIWAMDSGLNSWHPFDQGTISGRQQPNYGMGMDQNPVALVNIPRMNIFIDDGMWTTTQFGW